MTEKQVQGYETEIYFQKHMLENLGRWVNLFFLIASVGMILIFTFKKTNLLIAILGGVLMAIGVIGALIFGYGIKRGRENVNKIIDEFERVYHESQKKEAASEA